MAIKRMVIDGYGQVELNQVAFRRDGRIEAQCALDAVDFEKVSAEKARELNANHPVFETLKNLYGKDNDRLTKYAKLLYSQALLIEGLGLVNPPEFSNLVCELMV